MTTVTIPNRPKPGDLRDINAILADFDAITAVVNGNLDSGNIKDGSLKGSDFEAGTIAEDRLTPAVQTLLNKSTAGWEYEGLASSKEGVAGKYYVASTGPLTLTLPTPTAGRMIGVMAISGSPEVKVTASSGKIWGDFIPGQTTIILKTEQHVVLLATGSNWVIVSGEPKREQTYSAGHSYSQAEAEAGVETSVTRPAQVQLTALQLSSGTVRFFVGAVQVAELAEVVRVTTSLFVPPGVKWKAQIGSGTVNESHILL